MNKEQQIERLEKDVNKAIVKNWKASEVAKCLHEAGYRKQADTITGFTEKLCEYFSKTEKIASIRGDNADNSHIRNYFEGCRISYADAAYRTRKQAKEYGVEE